MFSQRTLNVRNIYHVTRGWQSFLVSKQLFESLLTRAHPFNRRPFSRMTVPNSSIPNKQQKATSSQAVFAAGENPTCLYETLDMLLEPSGGWRLCNQGQGIERLLKFKTFKSAWVSLHLLTDLLCYRPSTFSYISHVFCFVQIEH